MEMEPIRVGVIGLGRMGMNHCRVFSMLRSATLTAIYDMNPESATAAANKFSIQPCSNLDDFFDQVDAVSIVTPTPTHHALAVEAIERGKHLFVEKPFVETLEQADDLVARVQQSGLIAQVGHIERFNPAYTELKCVLENMHPLAINFRRLSPYVGSNTDVDVVLDLMIHDLDLVLDLVGTEPTAIDTIGLSAYGGSIDHATVNMHFPAGPLLSICASRVTEHKVRLIDVTAREMYVESDLLAKTVSIHRSMVGEYRNHNSRGVKYHQESIIERIHVPIAEPLFLELQHFLDSIQQNQTPLVSVEHGAKALLMATKIRAQLYPRLVEVPSLFESVSEMNGAAFVPAA